MLTGRLAIDGGAPVRTAPLPKRRLIGPAEREAALSVLDEAVETGDAFGYSGPHEREYGRAFAASLGGGHADAVNSGTNALYVGLAALELPPLSEVIVPPITDPGGVMPVPLLGCIPVPADADPRSYNTCAEAIARALTPRTRAVIVAHIGGDPVDMAPVLDLVRAHGLLLIEDCAQAHGALYRGRPVGTFGDLAVFSTMSGKHHCTGAQGGVVYTRDECLAWRVRRRADRGKPFGLEGDAGGGNVVAGLNCNSNELAAAIGLAQMERLPEIVRRRREVGEAVKRALVGNEVVSVGWQPPESASSYWFLRVRLQRDALRVDKERFCRALSAEGIAVTASYRHIAAEATWFREQRVLGQPGFPWNHPEYTGDRHPTYPLPGAVRATEEHLNLGLNERYGAREVDDILTALHKVVGAYRR